MKFVFLLLAALSLSLTTAFPVRAQTTLDLNSLVRPDMLNVQLAWLEHSLGPAKYVDEFSGHRQDRTYQTGECTLHAFTDGEKIVAYGVELAANCSFDLGSFMGIGRLAANQVTIGQIAGMHAPGAVTGFSTTCLQDCDNRADPIVAMHWQGANADDSMQIEAFAPAIGDAAIKAWDGWASALAKTNGGSPKSRGFTCPSFSDAGDGVAAFKDIRPSEIVVGHYDPTDDMFSKTCDTPRFLKHGSR